MNCNVNVSKRTSFNGYVPWKNHSYSKLLILVISHWRNRKLWNEIKEWGDGKGIKYSIVTGCNHTNLLDNITCVNSSDSYEYLIDKITNSIHFFYNIDESWTHVMKIDDTDIKDYKNKNFKLLEYELGTTSHAYFGRRIYFMYSCQSLNSSCRKYHWKHVTNHSIWFNKSYNGPISSMACGGCGYILSRTVLKNIRDEVDLNCPLEDVAIGNWMKSKKIKPRPFTFFNCFT